MEGPYTVYLIQSPNGSYVGRTRQELTKRIRGHIYSTKGSNTKRAIAFRDLSIEDLEVTVLEEDLSAEESSLKEEFYIQILSPSLNSTRGGRYDGKDANQILQELLEDPEWREEYIAKLSEGVKASEAHQSRLLELTELSIQWRRENPRQTYYNARRASRIARRRLRERGKREAKPKKEPPINRLESHKRRSKAVAGVWARRSEAEKAEIARKIAETTKRNHAKKSEEERERHLRQLAEARKHIDHDVRLKRQQEYFARRRQIQADKEKDQ